MHRGVGRFVRASRGLPERSREHAHDDDGSSHGEEMDQTDEESRVFPDPAKVAWTLIFSDVVNLDGRGPGLNLVREVGVCRQEN